MKSAIYNVQGSAGEIHFNQKRIEVMFQNCEQGELDACEDYFRGLEMGDVSNLLEEHNLDYKVELVEVF